MAESVLSGANSSTNDTFFIPTNNNSGNNIKKKHGPELVAQCQSKSQPIFLQHFGAKLHLKGLQAFSLLCLYQSNTAAPLFFLFFLSFQHNSLLSGKGVKFLRFRKKVPLSFPPF